MTFNKKTYYIFVLLFSFSYLAYAGLFGEKEEVKEIKPEANAGLDGVMVLDFAWRTDLDFDAKKLQLIATYDATKPDAKGIKTITTESCLPNPRLPVPSSCSKYTRPLQYRYIVPPEWISISGNKLLIKLAERIKGAGDYQLTGIRFDCPKNLCKDKKFNHRESGAYESNFMLGFEKRSKDDTQRTLLLGSDVTSSFTAQFSGVKLGLVASTGHYGEDYSRRYNPTETGGFANVLQAKDGKWHFSDLAFKTRYEPSCKSDYNGPSIQASKYASMKWAAAHPAATYGSVYNTYVFDKEFKKIPIKPAQWSGCVVFKAEDPEYSNGENEERTYTFENGKLYKRRIQLSTKGTYLDETIYLDSQQKLSTYNKTTFVDKTQKETNQLWNQLEHKAYPETKPAPNVDIKVILQEADDVLRIITPEFKP